MWWYKIPVLLVVATANHISLSDKRIKKLRSRSSFTRLLLLAFEGCFWTLVACEVALIWSVNHLRSPLAHRILVVFVHPFANFPPKIRISPRFTAGWSISTVSLVVHLLFSLYRRRIHQSPASPDHDARFQDHVSRKRMQTARRVVHGSSITMAIGSTMCCVAPGSFVSECWVWRTGVAGTLLCLIGAFYVVFWLGVIWRFVVSLVGSLRCGAVVPSDTNVEEDVEMLVVERVD